MPRATQGHGLRVDVAVHAAVLGRRRLGGLQHRLGKIAAVNTRRRVAVQQLGLQYRGVGG